MEDVLAKIRPHTSSSLAHQKAPATLLRALEATFRERKTENTPTAYFAALITTLEATLHKNDTSLGDGDVLPAQLYLLALVIPFVSQPIIRTNLSTVLSLTNPLFPSLIPHAPPLRSQLTLYHTVLQSLDRSQLEAQGVRQAFASILRLCLDLRPKVRRKAVEVVKDVLAAPPSPLARHPYSHQVAEWAKSALTDANEGAFAKSKSSGKDSEAPVAETAIHLLAFLKSVLPNLPSSTLPSIANLILTLPRLGNPYLSQSAYSILAELFSTTAQIEGSVVVDVSGVLKAILSSPPSKSDIILTSSWVQLLGSAMLACSITDPETCSTEIDKVWRSVWFFLESSDASTRKAVAESLKLLTRCFSPTLIVSAIHEVGQANASSTLGKIILETTKALDSLAFARSMPELLSVISSLIINLGNRESRTSPSFAESLLLPLVQRVGELRIQEGFEHKEAADSTLAAAMRVLGPELMLRILPLNLEPSDRVAGQEPRAFLLPLLPQPHPSPLRHFVSYFVPLSERMFDLQQKAENENRSSEAKVWNVLIAQIWTGLSGYCFATVDLREAHQFSSFKALNPTFSQLLSQLIYSQPELRLAVLKALKIMVESNVALSSTDHDQTDNNSISKGEASQNVSFLQTQAESWLAVFFNVFGNVDMDGRGIVGDVISAWVAIAGKEEITKAYHKVVALFTQDMTKQSSRPASNNSTNLTATAQDLLILLLPHLSSADATALFQLCLTSEVLNNPDNGIQKRGYKILGRLVDGGKVTINAERVLNSLDELGDGLLPAAKKDRFRLFSSLISLIPSTALHVVPFLIPEAVLGTKEPSEKARTASFELIVAMGKKMSEGGVVKRGMIGDMDEDNAGEVVATVEEYMTMVAGGLAGASPHMISATVTAISRLVFEFKDSISSEMQIELFTTMLVFLSSANREIVKSVLGFVKLAIHTLPTELIRPHLKQLVPALLGWSHDHKNHFKAKVRHIFERMLRRFGWDDVYACAGEEEAAKVLVNIKKRKERAKRKKATTIDNDGDGHEAPTAKRAGGDAFEDVLYGSESELEDSDDEQHAGRSNAPSKRKAATIGARLRVDDDEPIDLLHGAASRISVSQSNRRRKPGQDAARFKIDSDTGKMIIDEDSDADVVTTDVQKKTATDIGGTAYREGITSVDGFTRGPNGRIKFNKDTKKRRRENEDLEGDVEMIDGDLGKGKKNKQKTDVKLGHEFKAKKAGGDLKKGNVDPYAYLTLSQAAKRRGSIGRIGITGKR